MKNKKNETITMPLKKLRPHPLQATYYQECSASEDEALAENILANGQRDPVVVMPAGNAAGLKEFTVLDGHRRLSAMQSIGAKDVIVLIRHDLKEADLSTVNQEFLKYNFLRRNMDRLEMARVAKGLYETELGYGSRRFDQRERKRFYERIGAIMKMSGKTLQRYVSLLTTPLPVQNAVRQGLIKLVVGVTISTLPRQKQQELADRIDKLTGKKEIRGIVKEYVTTRESGRHANPGMALGCMLRALAAAMADVGDRIDKIPASALARNLELLRRVRIMIDALIERGENAPPPDEFQKEFAAFLEEQKVQPGQQGGIGAMQSKSSTEAGVDPKPGLAIASSSKKRKVDRRDGDGSRSHPSRIRSPHGAGHR